MNSQNSKSPLLFHHRCAGEGGFSLIELMVAITIGLLLVAGVTSLFVSNNRARDEMERSSRQIENGRYAVDVLTGDLRNAGYYAEFNPTVLTPPTSLPDVCATDVATLKTAIPIHIQGSENSAAGIACITDVRANTDVLVIRHASTCVAGVADCDAIAANTPYFQASLCSGTSELGSSDPNNHYALDTNVASLTRHKRDCATTADIRRYKTNIYFIANNDVAGDGIPTLKRAELGAGTFTISSVVSGIENLQLQFGLDTNNDGVPDVYTTDPSTYNGCSAATNPTCVGNWQNAMAVEFYLLARNTEQSTGYTDTKTYDLGGTNVGPFNDAIKRHAYQSTVKLYNPSGRRVTP